MGTNYYAIKRKLSLYGSALHIGKSSAGWKFLFRGYQDEERNYGIDRLNINSIDDWKKYIKENNLAIFNEYDEEISYDDFFKMVEKFQKEENEDNFCDCCNVNGYRFVFRDFG